MTYEFLWVSMHGPQWIPCTFINRNNFIAEVTIRYYDDFLQGEVEATVEDDFVRMFADDRLIDLNTPSSIVREMDAEMKVRLS